LLIVKNNPQKNRLKESCKTLKIDVFLNQDKTEGVEKNIKQFEQVLQNKNLWKIS